MITVRTNRGTSLMQLLAVVLLACASRVLQAHELESNRLTLVLREPNHLVASFHLNFIDLLHVAVAPHLPFDEFLAVYSTLPVPVLQSQLNRVEQSVQSTLLLSTQDHEELKLKDWLWPDAAAVQEQMRQHVMKALTMPEAHDKQQQMEVHAEAVSKNPIISARLILPALLGQTVVVWYHVNQALLESGKDYPEMKF